MSRFFNVTLNSDVVLDDSSIGTLSGWTSQKILDEIIKYRVGKLEELGDVDVVNKKNGQVLAFSGTTQKFTTIDLQAIGEAAGLTLKQINKMGVIGTPTAPEIIELPINTIDFNVPKVNVLKFILGDQNVIKTENGFSNSDLNDFVPDDLITFDGTAHLVTKSQHTMNYEGDIEEFKAYSLNLDFGVYKSINNISINTINTDTVLNISAIPTDRLLIPAGDLNLSNASNIDYFNLSATGSNIRVICSIDSGVTWKTFDGAQWNDISFSVEDVKTKGIDLNVFNKIGNMYWNMLITTNKIRFAYLLMDNNTIDELKLQYDAQGYWVEAKPTDYDVIYASNSLLEVKLYFSGDVKINY